MTDVGTDGLTLNVENFVYKKSIEFFVKMFKEFYEKEFNGDWKKFNYHDMRNLISKSLIQYLYIHKASVESPYNFDIQIS